MVISEDVTPQTLARQALAERSRELTPSASRWITDPILGKEQTFTTQLVGKGPYSEYYGDLTITLDTASYGENFITTSVIIFVSGVLRALAMALVLYMVYHWLLTKPLSKIIEYLSNINPDRPSEHKLPMLKGNEKNELGLWINTANDLLASIERNTHLRREAENSLLRMSQYDFLTGLPNRMQLQQQLDQILEDAGRLQRRVAVLCVGLDDFKGINEQFSYQTGDQLLLALSDRLRSHSGRLGALARLGGDQFALVHGEAHVVDGGETRAAPGEFTGQIIDLKHRHDESLPLAQREIGFGRGQLDRGDD